MNYVKTKILRILYPIIDRFRAVVLNLAGGKSVGVRALVVNESHQVLLVRHTYRKGWYMPGGGVDNGEGIFEALSRELREEVGITPRGMAQIFGIYRNSWRGRHDYPVFMIVRSFEGTPKVCDPREIAEIGWFSLDDLPDDTTPKTRLRIDEFKHGAQIHMNW
ncbi:MAG TPA: NUDIX domain-containing protein [Rhizomicrobium sp.]|nr:NUDIX domain-containing protein [Rhizomicrobium sp.]